MAALSTVMLCARLRRAYPHLQFELVARAALGFDEESGAPAWLICFTDQQHTCIFDPYSYGFSSCDPMEVYGISFGDAEILCKHNVVKAA